MMNPLEYLKNKLELLSQQFTNIQIRYAYNEQIETHIIELTPEKEYYSNDSLDNAWIEISIEFSQRFPAENISFISADSSLAIEKPVLEWNHVLNNQIDILSEEFYAEFNIMQIEIHNMTFPIFFESKPEQPAHFTYNVQLNHIDIIGHINLPDGGNTQYAMAA